MMAPDALDLNREFARTRFDAIEAAIESGDAAEVERLGELARAEYLPVHDGMRDMVGATLDFAARATLARGRRGDRQARDRADHGRRRGAAVRPGRPARARAVDRCRLALARHARSSVVEDDETVSFELEPCGSGGRLELEGRYDGDVGFLRSARPSPSTFMQPGSRSTRTTARR